MAPIFARLRLSIFLSLLIAVVLPAACLAQAAPPVQTGQPAAVANPEIAKAGGRIAGPELAHPEAVTTVYSFIISNEAPGHLVDYLIAQGHGSETLLQVLSYLKGQSGGIISDAFYNQVAGAQPGSEVVTATLINYAGLVGAGIEIAADGTINIPSVEGKNYKGVSGYETAPSQNGQFVFTYAQDTAHYIYTHGNDYGGGVSRDYYAFGIAWREGFRLFLPLVIR